MLTFTAVIILTPGNHGDAVAAAAVGDVDGSTAANEWEQRARANEGWGGWACNDSRMDRSKGFRLESARARRLTASTEPNG